MTTVKYPAVRCPDPGCNYRQERTAVMRRLAEGKDFIRCDECGGTITLERAGKSVSLSQSGKRLLEAEQRRTARQPRFKASLVRLAGLKMYKDASTQKPRCFISYAWGVEKDELWVRTLAKDLAEAGVDVVMDTRDNADPGLSVPRFVSTIDDHDHVIVVGTPLYVEKYKANDAGGASVLAAEMQVIGTRLLGNEKQKRTIIPLLLRGNEESSLPALLKGHVYIDFRREEDYFPSLFRLVVNLYDMSPRDAEVEALIKDMNVQV
ncbi:MAG TPA: toll/interleukin-1 receptor domain-containing protein [Ardenticatenaceae bacterium]|nr:toll/interleukin-1 receptor domain-containing protein [Ardenticatenaceae bacterium]